MRSSGAAHNGCGKFGESHDGVGHTVRCAVDDGARSIAGRAAPVRIGIDVGGTNTDGVLMDGTRIVARAKTATTPDVTEGITRALASVVGNGAVPDSVRAVMIGTTHFTNAVVEGRRLSRVAVVRLCLPAAEAVPPMCDWPDPLRHAVTGAIFMCRGGHEFDGSPIAAIDRDELRRVAERIGELGLASIALSSVFSPVNAEFELEAASVISAELGADVAISLSHEIGRLGLLERENATIMNAALRALGTEIVSAFRRALDESGLAAPAFVSQNDGTLMSLEWVERYPVSTFASGPTNSMRGAALLSGLGDCAVVDIGGTTTDVGILRGGFPREATTLVEIAGVRTNFRMPDVLPVALGGGSEVHAVDPVAIGPRSVGYRLAELGRVFGGPVLTTSDLAVAAGRASFGDRVLVADLDAQLVSETMALIDRTVEAAIDRMKTTAEPVPLVAVGGGSVLLGDRLEGVVEVIRPDHRDVANAVGAAIAQVGGEVDVAYSLSKISRTEAIEDAKRQATSRAVAAGASAGTVAVVDVEQISIPYVANDAIRVKAKAVGDLELEALVADAHL
jgi:N-methylhydantoinase A/oxoprolinase/acetone carboxylase beta subunit